MDGVDEATVRVIKKFDPHGDRFSRRGRMLFRRLKDDYMFKKGVYSNDTNVRVRALAQYNRQYSAKGGKKLLLSDADHLVKLGTEIPQRKNVSENPEPLPASSRGRGVYNSQAPY